MAKRANAWRYDRTWWGRDGVGVSGMVVLFGVVTALSGCGRVLTITQESHINTAMHWARPAEERTGEPLEVNIVCVTPADLKKDGNELLSPGSGITSKLWYENRPEKSYKDDEGYSGLRLPRNQILLFTDDKTLYGKPVGGRLRGAVVDHREKVVVRFNFPGPLHSDKSVIYVFPKFVDRRGQVLPVEPALFHPPGAYRRELFCKIGVDEGRDNFGQYIRNETPRKLHGRDKDD